MKDFYELPENFVVPRAGAWIETLDCHGILVMRIGYSPRQQLEEKGLLVLEWPATVEEGCWF